MIARQERAICMLMMHAHDEIKKVKKLAGDNDLAEILCDRKQKWVKSRHCPQKHKLAFANAGSFVKGAARALDVCVFDFVAQLLDEDENDDALVMGSIARHARNWRVTSDK